MDPLPLDEGPRPKSDKWRLKLTWAPFWRENQLVRNQKMSLKRRAHDMKNKDAKLGSKLG